MPGLGGMAIPQMAMAPAFAGGGSSAAMPNAGMVSFTLDIGGVRSELTGLREDVARLERASVQAQMAQTTKRSMSWDT
jgi:hypothetical protein